jgi:hypothetical protein
VYSLGGPPRQYTFVFPLVQFLHWNGTKCFCYAIRGELYLKCRIEHSLLMTSFEINYTIIAAKSATNITGWDSV